MVFRGGTRLPEVTGDGIPLRNDKFFAPITPKICQLRAGGSQSLLAKPNHLRNSQTEL